ncbi:class I SAM-dependent methyltransferase [Nocardia donostiensis]|uniref:SAM-dependent methyltransferase n=1 Tax=Nocardia donostiensis TaxID=1538463 RepID=A0A1V2TLQ9_9NOCA|nr:class I SAM-dependent methyltransferase [Nocardia donostiensis]ONM50432.1 SAM-dependent methyltransferase [Nocardia donostiensis]OQS17333.1 SAM-dependent methyltransferase [Nocardia donostiensis]OQS18717.1 SAM-dependent methyltransferase [Nocardia donostiensis]
MDQQFWDELYGSQDQLFSGLPNDVLVAEVAGLEPGQALDVGCGEGADACWLAEQGWQVTAVDVSQVALERAAKIRPDVSWSHADLAATPPPRRSFDLVTAHYFPIEHEPGHTIVRGLIDAVAPGGTLLFVGHDPADFPDEHEHEHDYDPRDFYLPGEVADLLDDEWVILVNETRARTRPGPPGTHHVADLVLRAQRKAR